MKKILGAILLCVFALPLAAVSFGDRSGDKEPMLDLFSTGVNSGLSTATIPGKIFTVGLQGNIAINTEDGVLGQASDTDNYFFPMLYANLHIGDFLIFGRGLAMKQNGISTWYAGGGLGYIVSDYKLFFPQIRILGAYHFMNGSGSDDFKISTITANAVADYKIPILPIHALANIAYERNMISTSWNISNPDFGVNRIRFSVAAQVQILILGVAVEYTIIPNPNFNLGVSLGF